MGAALYDIYSFRFMCNVTAGIVFTYVILYFFFCNGCEAISSTFKNYEEHEESERQLSKVKKLTEISAPLPGHVVVITALTDLFKFMIGCINPFSMIREINERHRVENDERSRDLRESLLAASFIGGDEITSENNAEIRLVADK